MDYLFKYSSLNCYTLENLEKLQLCFNNFEALNDPFESCVNFFYKQSDGDKKEWSNLGLNDPSFGLADGLSMMTREVFLFKFRITCFTDSPYNKAMWAYYAEGHKGVCVAYLKDDVERVSCFFKQVNYTEEPKSFDYKKSLNELNNLDKIAGEIILTKHSDWKNENEWRAVKQVVSKTECSMEEYLNKRSQNKDEIYCCDMSEGKHYKTDARMFVNCKPHKIYLGLLMPENIRNEYIEICKKNDIILYQMVKGENNYELKAEKVIPNA